MKDVMKDVKRPILSLREHRHSWAVVLAGDDTQRSRAAPDACAPPPLRPVPYRAPEQGPCLLHEALARARSFVPREHVCAVVAAQHRHWWERLLWQLPKSNAIVQPENRGTGLSVLLSLLHILRRDARAQVVLLPAGHHVRQDAGLTAALRRAAALAAAQDGDRILLLGVRPDRLESGISWIVPGEPAGGGTLRVRALIDATSTADPAALRPAGEVLWNTCWVAARARVLLNRYAARWPDIVERLRDAVERETDEPTARGTLARLYARLPELDFVHDVLSGQEAHLQALPVEGCGWTDLSRCGGLLEEAAAANMPAARGPSGPWWALPRPGASADAAAPL